MANAWFRLYAKFADNAKVQILTEALQRRYVMLLCLHCDNRYLSRPDDEIALSLRITLDDWLDTKKIFIERNLLNKDGSIHDWETSQYISDIRDPTAAERQKRYRESKRNNRNESVTSRSPESESDTDTDIKKEKIKKENHQKFSVSSLIHDGVSEQAAQEFWDLRKSKRAPLTSIAWEGFKREAKKINWDIDQVIRECITRGWQGFKSEWILKDQIHNARASPQKQQRESLSEKDYSFGIQADGTTTF